MILIGFGSNQPFCGVPPADVVRAAAAAVHQATGFVAGSRLYASPAWPDPTDPAFVNAVAAVRWTDTPDRLLIALQRIEAAFGRRRSLRNAPRTLDLDLIAFGDEVRVARRPDGLSLPHPMLDKRDFVLAPLLEVAPGWRCPATGRSARAMLARLPERTATPIDDAPPLLTGALVGRS